MPLRYVAEPLARVVWFFGICDLFVICYLSFGIYRPGYGALARTIQVVSTLATCSMPSVEQFSGTSLRRCQCL